MPREPPVLHDPCLILTQPPQSLRCKWRQRVLISNMHESRLINQSGLPRQENLKQPSRQTTGANCLGSTMAVARCERSLLFRSSTSGCQQNRAPRVRISRMGSIAFDIKNVIPASSPVLRRSLYWHELPVINDLVFIWTYLSRAAVMSTKYHQT